MEMDVRVVVMLVVLMFLMLLMLFMFRRFMMAVVVRFRSPHFIVRSTSRKHNYGCQCES